MSPLKRFFGALWSAATDPEAYLKFRKLSTGQGVGYLALILLMTSVAMAIPLFVGLFGVAPAVQTFISEGKTEMMHLYPAGLVLTIKDGTLTTNVQEPYYIEIPATWKTYLMKDQAAGDLTIDHLVAIDTKAGAESYAQYHSLFLLTKTALVMPDKNGALKLVPYASMRPDMVVTQAKVNALLAKILSYADLAGPFLMVLLVLLCIFLPFLITGFRLLGYFVYIAVMSLLLLLLAWIMGRKTAYSELYRLSYFGLTLPLAYGLVSTLTGFGFPLLFTLLFLVWMGVVIAQLPVKKA